LRTSGIELETRLVASLPESDIDADQIGQIVVNLLVNAQHVLDETPPPHRIAIETGQLNGGVYCRVSDNGPGVPEELRQRIFDPFFTTKGSGIGTGVGLSVSRSIAREHGGELRLEDSGVGAAFLLWLPLTPSVQGRVTADQPLRADELRAHLVLVVDDEPEMGEMLGEILRSAGLEAELAANGREALAWLDEHDCDLVLSDIRMPDMDGPSLWRELKARHPELARHMAFITGDTLSASIAPFLKETGLPWLEKPFTPEQLLALVARIEAD
jgi:two-component system NtrC family sensor kinase